jgi:Negative regulator of sigma F
MSDDRIAAPAPSQALLDRVTSMRPVRTRTPLRSFLIVLSASLVYAIVPLLVFHIRPDLPYLSIAGVVIVAALWLAAFVVPLGLALVPPRGQVLPDPLRAARSGAMAAGLLILVSLLYPTEAPGHSLPIAFWPGVAHCLWFVVRMWLGAFLLALFAIRRLLFIGSWRLGAAIGASAGALSGLVLYFLCPYADRWHVAVAHGGGVAVCGVLGAIIVSRL